MIVEVKVGYESFDRDEEKPMMEAKVETCSRVKAGLVECHRE